MGTWRFFRWRPITLMKFQPDPAGEAEVPERSQKRQDWVAMILVCLVNLSLSSFGGWFCFIKVIFTINRVHMYIYIYIHIHACLGVWNGYLFVLGVGLIFFDSKNQDDQKHRYWGITLKALPSRAHPIWVKKKSPTWIWSQNMTPKTPVSWWPKTLNPKSLIHFDAPNTVMKVEITFFFMFSSCRLSWTLSIL